ncbi:MAG: hypothetical protein P4L64_06640 [Caulobacteraceae bacterium]|nr:hypothetical protein [Caulobacteraceae bacterium]
MGLPIDVEYTPELVSPAIALEAEAARESLLESLEPDVYARIAERRSQLEDAETLRRVRAL